MNKEIYEFEISKNAEGGILATAGVKNAGDSYRIAGPKAWGGSSTIAKIDISQRDLVEFVRFYAPGAHSEIIACDHPAAAPQVVADERAAFEVAFCKTELADPNAQPGKDYALIRAANGDYAANATHAAWIMWQSARAAPVQAQEPVNWQEIALFYQDLYSKEKHRAPVQPVAAPVDLSAIATYNWDNDGMEEFSDDRGQYFHAETVRELLSVAPAAQGDAMNLECCGSTEFCEREACPTQDAEHAEFYRHLRDEVIGDDPGEINMKPGKSSGLDAACRAAIAAKAAS